MAKLTPMMQQYMEVKNRHKDCILFFRLGDFYEMFFEDALTASKVLEITLTGRDCGLDQRAPMCGIPFHSAQAYIAKMVAEGYKVAICEQVEDAQQGKGIVKREVVKIITAGTIIDTSILDEKSNNYLASVYIRKNDISMSYTDISTGKIFAVDFTGKSLFFSLSDLFNEILKIKPSEIITNKDLKKLAENYELTSQFTLPENINVSGKSFTADEAENIIRNHFEVITLNTLGFSDTDETGIYSIAALLDFLYSTQKDSLNNLNELNFYRINDYLIIDSSTRRNMELTESIRGAGRKNTLFSVLDNTRTAMGARKLKRWILEPLQNADHINRRLDFIDNLFSEVIISNNMREHMKHVYDIERITNKIIHGNCNGRDINALKTSISALPDLKEDISNMSCDAAIDISDRIDVLSDVFSLIDSAIKEEAPASVTEGNIIKDGYNMELDELRNISKNANNWLTQYLQSEKTRTGITNLKVGYNKVFGYYIEITKSHFNKIPEDYIRKQTLSSGERFITPELKEMETKIINAQSRIFALEYKIFNEVKDFISSQIVRIQRTADLIAQIDALNSLFTVAMNNNYKRPVFNDNGYINISEGRHPVVEQVVKDERYIPNSTYLDSGENRFSIITGPNMAGKSTYMRQVALIVLMAHVGSFVPAESADICIVDKIFTRVGASDDLTQGQSTFMVEMSEVSNIIKNASSDSLIILDEIGRGTSTYDGLSIAWAVTEYIVSKIKAKTLFATHYHEMSELEDKIEGIKNYRILVKETSDEIIFLRKIARGSIDRSYGIYVAKIAGIPAEIIFRADNILKKLEETDVNRGNIAGTVISRENQQLVFGIDDNKYKDFIMENILNIDINTYTPLEALNYLSALVKDAKELNP